MLRLLQKQWAWRALACFAECLPVVAGCPSLTASSQVLFHSTTWFPLSLTHSTNLPPRFCVKSSHSFCKFPQSTCFFQKWVFHSFTECVPSPHSIQVATQLDATEDFTTNATPVHHGKELGASDGASWLHAPCSPKIVNIHDKSWKLIHIFAQCITVPFALRRPEPLAFSSPIQLKIPASNCGDKVPGRASTASSSCHWSKQNTPRNTKNIKKQQSTVALSALGLRVAFPVRDELVGAWALQSSWRKCVAFLAEEVTSTHWQSLPLGHGRGSMLHYQTLTKLFGFSLTTSCQLKAVWVKAVYCSVHSDQIFNYISSR